MRAFNSQLEQMVVTGQNKEMHWRRHHNGRHCWGPCIVTLSLNKPIQVLQYRSGWGTVASQRENVIWNLCNNHKLWWVAQWVGTWWLRSEGCWFISYCRQNGVSVGPLTPIAPGPDCAYFLNCTLLWIKAAATLGVSRLILKGPACMQVFLQVWELLSLTVR